MSAPKGNDYWKLREKDGITPMYKTPEELENRVNDYFEDEERIHTISGLAFFLGFSTRQSLYDYEAKEGFTYIIKKARLFIEMIYEEKLHGNSNAGAIFALKNFGWSDKQEIDHTSKGDQIPIQIIIKPE